tara:strand:- start:856 stop:1092 length:237 start_codon:yes stop_codon:yes gene_type:complete
MKNKRNKRLEVLIVECQNKLYIENFKVEHLESQIELAKFKREREEVIDNYILRKKKLEEKIDELLDRLIHLKKEKENE